MLKTIHYVCFVWYYLEANEIVGESGDWLTEKLSPFKESDSDGQDAISFVDVDIITPAQKLLARQLRCDVVQGKSLLVTGSELISLATLLCKVTSMHLHYFYYCTILKLILYQMIKVQMEVGKVLFSESFVVFGPLWVADFPNQHILMKIVNMVVASSMFLNDHTHA